MLDSHPAIPFTFYFLLLLFTFYSYVLLFTFYFLLFTFLSQELTADVLTPQQSDLDWASFKMTLPVVTWIYEKDLILIYFFLILVLL